MKARRTLVAVIALGVAASGFARVGEKAEDLKRRFGRPQTQPNKETLVWIIEERAGPLLYTVTIDDKGVSIAEGLKPMKSSGLMLDELAKDFIEEQIATLPDTKTLRQMKPGEKYTFAGQSFVCTKDEVVSVDDEKGLLVIWSRAEKAKSVMAVTRGFLERKAVERPKS